MVPTELLAIQHYEHLHNLLESIDLETKPSIALLTGSTPTKQSRIIRQAFDNHLRSTLIYYSNVIFALLMLSPMDFLGPCKW